MTDVLASWIDGIVTREVPADDRGLHYGDGLFETVLVRRGVPRFLERHLARLARGCDRLAIPFAAGDALRSDIAAAVARAPSRAIIKIVVTRGSARQRGYAPAGTEIPRRLVALFEAAPIASLEAGALLHIAATPASDQPHLAGIKHLNRLENVLAAREARDAAAFDALMFATDGRLVSGAMSNVFIVAGGRVFTPALDRAGVEGVMREIVLRECAALGIETTVRDLDRSDLLRAEEAFVTNARVGVVPVGRVGEHAFRMNAISRRIAAHVETLDA